MDEQNNQNNEDYLNKLPNTNEDHPTIHEIEQRVKQQKDQAKTLQNEASHQEKLENIDNEPSPPTSRVGQSFAPEAAPPVPPPLPQSEPEDSKEVPDYLRGADSPPPTGQSVHPAGTYQPKPGETAQSSVDGNVGVVQNMQNQAADLTKKSPLKIILIILASLASLALVAFLLFTFVFTATTTEIQDAQVNNQLKSDTSRLLSAMGEYATDHNGSYPDMQLEQIKDFAENYLPANFIDPRTEEPYELVTDLPDKNSEIQYLRYAQCTTDGSIEAIEDDENKVAFRVYLNDSSLFCVDNSN